MVVRHRSPLNCFVKAIIVTKLDDDDTEHVERELNSFTALKPRIKSSEREIRGFFVRDVIVDRPRDELLLIQSNFRFKY